MYSVSFLHTNATWNVSRYFTTLRASRRWVRFLLTQAYVIDVAIHRGGPGGEWIEP